MQTLWSRTAQATSSCRGRVCLHTSNTLIRRTATAASRRKVNGADIFTAFYTTILGTAAIIDASRKDVRRKELDEKLEKARAELKRLEAEVEADSGRERPQDYAAPLHAGNSIKKYDGDEMLRDIRQSAGKLYTSNPRLSWLQNQLEWVGIEAAILAEESNHEIRLRLPTSDQHMELTTSTIEALVEQLLSRCRVETKRVRNLARLRGAPMAGSQAEKLLEEVDALRKNPLYPCYEVPAKDFEAAAEARSDLNKAFRHIFNHVTNVTELVGRICYNLLISSTPPNIHHYNTLIAGFNRIERPDLATPVVYSYLFNTTWPATQQTVTCLLNHARSANDRELFRHLSARMRGAAEDGLHQEIIPKQGISNEQTLRQVQRDFFERKNAYVKKTKPDGVVFDSLIRGWLHFGLIDRAARSFMACIRGGFEVSLDTIDQLLSACLAELDRTTARAMVQDLAVDFKQLEQFFESLITRHKSLLARKIVDMLRALVDLSGFRETFNCGDARFAVGDVANVLDSIRDAVTVRLQESIGAVPEAAYIPAIGLDKAISSLDRRRSEYARITAVVTAATRYEVLKGNIQRLTAHVKVAILKHEIGYDLDPSSRLPPVNWHTRQPTHDPYPPVFWALRRVSLGGRPFSSVSVKHQLVTGMPDKILADHLLKHRRWQNMSFEMLVGFYDSQTYQKPPSRYLAVEESAHERTARIAKLSRRRIRKGKIVIQDHLIWAKKIPVWESPPPSSSYRQSTKKEKLPRIATPACPELVEQGVPRSAQHHNLWVEDARPPKGHIPTSNRSLSPQLSDWAVNPMPLQESPSSTKTHIEGKKLPQPRFYWEQEPISQQQLFTWGLPPWSRPGDNKKPPQVVVPTSSRQRPSWKVTTSRRHVQSREPLMVATPAHPLLSAEACA
jgi:hypothetical protein